MRNIQEQVKKSILLLKIVLTLHNLNKLYKKNNNYEKGKSTAGERKFFLVTFYWKILFYNDMWIR